MLFVLDIRRCGIFEGVSNHQRLDCLPNRLFRRRSKDTSKFGVTGLGKRNPPVTDGFPSERASNAENISIWWRHNEMTYLFQHKLYCRSATMVTTSGNLPPHENSFEELAMCSETPLWTVCIIFRASYTKRDTLKTIYIREWIGNIDINGCNLISRPLSRLAEMQSKFLHGWVITPTEIYDRNYDVITCPFPHLSKTSCNMISSWARFLSLAGSKLRLCWANHSPGYWSNLPCDWPSTA